MLFWDTIYSHIFIYQKLIPLNFTKYISTVMKEGKQQHQVLNNKLIIMK